MSVDLIRQIVDHVVGETLIGGRKSGAMVADGETAGSIEQFKTLLAEKLRTAGGSPGSSSGSSYLVWVGKVSESGTDDPTVIESQNTTGDTFVWTRNALGKYRMTGSGGLFAQSWFINRNCMSGNNVGIPISWDAPNSHAALFTQISVNVLEMDIYDADFSLVELSSLTGTELLIFIEFIPT